MFGFDNLFGAAGGMGGNMASSSTGPLETRVTSPMMFGGAQKGPSNLSVILIAATVAGITYYVAKK